MSATPLLVTRMVCSCCHLQALLPGSSTSFSRVSTHLATCVSCPPSGLFLGLAAFGPSVAHEETLVPCTAHLDPVAVECHTYLHIPLSLPCHCLEMSWGGGWAWEKRTALTTRGPGPRNQMWPTACEVDAGYAGGRMFSGHTALSVRSGH